MASVKRCDNCGKETPSWLAGAWLTLDTDDAYTECHDVYGEHDFCSIICVGEYATKYGEEVKKRMAAHEQRVAGIEARKREVAEMGYDPFLQDGPAA